MSDHDHAAVGLEPAPRKLDRAAKADRPDPPSWQLILVFLLLMSIPCAIVAFGTGLVPVPWR